MLYFVSYEGHRAERDDDSCRTADYFSLARAGKNYWRYMVFIRSESTLWLGSLIVGPSYAICLEVDLYRYTGKEKITVG